MRVNYYSISVLFYQVYKLKFINLMLFVKHFPETVCSLFLNIVSGNLSLSNILI